VVNKFVGVTLVLISFGCVQSFAGINDGLVAWYPLDGNANDASGNGFHGSEFGGINYTAGVVGQCGIFDGVDDFIQCSNVMLPLGSSARTLAAWIKIDSFQHLGPTVLEYGSNIDGRNCGMRVVDKSGHQWQFSFWSIEYDLNTYIYPPLDQWVHVAMVYDETSNLAVAYQNGHEIGSRPVIPDTLLSQNGLAIGRLAEMQISQQSYFYWDGLIDDVRIYDVALSPSEVAELSLQGDHIEPNEDLLVYYPFEGDAVDASGNGNHGTPCGDVDLNAHIVNGNLTSF